MDQLVAIRELLLIENLSGLCSGESWRTKMLLVTGKLCFGALVCSRNAKIPERRNPLRPLGQLPTYSKSSVVSND